MKKANPPKRLKKTHVRSVDEAKTPAPEIVSIAVALPGDIVYVEHTSDGQSRSVVAVNFNTLEKGAIYMTRGSEGVWFMATKFTNASQDAAQRIVFQYDGPYR